MKPASFAYHVPNGLEDALAILSEVAPEDGRVLAGGQSLVPMMAYRVARPAHLVDINGITSFSRLAVEPDALSIGACVRHAAFQTPVESGPLGAAMCSVVRHIAHQPIRVRGTFCGSLAHADPASEWCLVAVTMGAELIARSASGTRRIASSDFFDGVMSTTLRPDEVLVEARLPLLPPDTRFGFTEFSRRAGDFAVAMAFVIFRLCDGRITEPRIGIGGAEAYPRRIAAAEAALEGHTPDAMRFRAAADAAAAMIEPLEDATNNGPYRRDLVRALTRRALEQAMA